MNSEMSEYVKKVEDLRKKAFTDELKNNEVLIPELFDSLKLDIDKLDIYEDGAILRVKVELTEDNKQILSKCIKDFDSYIALVDCEYDFRKEENKTDLISIIEYMEVIHGVVIRYDTDSEEFY